MENETQKLPRLETLIIKAITDAPADAGMVEIAIRIAVTVEEAAKLTWRDELGVRKQRVTWQGLVSPESADKLSLL